MTKQARITATYKPNEGETYQVTVRLDSSYPDALDTARGTACRVIRDMLADSLRQYAVEEK